jgi:hypothetical protein
MGIPDPFFCWKFKFFQLFQIRWASLIQFFVEHFSFSSFSNMNVHTNMPIYAGKAGKARIFNKKLDQGCPSNLEKLEKLDFSTKSWIRMYPQTCSIDILTCDNVYLVNFVWCVQRSDHLWLPSNKQTHRLQL